jgi:hypothetical protein
MKIFLQFICLITFSSCVIKPQKPIGEKVAENNKDYKIEYLFSHDGCKMYRFLDRGNQVYFSNCTGEITSILSDSIPHIKTMNRKK